MNIGGGTYCLQVETFGTGSSCPSRSPGESRNPGQNSLWQGPLELAGAKTAPSSNRASGTTPCQRLFCPAGLEGLREGHDEPVPVAAPVVLATAGAGFHSVDQKPWIPVLVRRPRYFRLEL
jgi:hypothetical protein